MKKNILKSICALSALLAIAACGKQEATKQNNAFNQQYGLNGYGQCVDRTTNYPSPHGMSDCNYTTNNQCRDYYGNSIPCSNSGICQDAYGYQVPCNNGGVSTGMCRDQWGYQVPCSTGSGSVASMDCSGMWMYQGQPYPYGQATYCSTGYVSGNLCSGRLYYSQNGQPVMCQ